MREVKISITTLLGVFICYLSIAQTFRFEHFDTSDGIHFPFIYTLEQDEDGFLWIGTGEGLYRYDGFSFNPYLEKDSLAEDFILSSLKDSQGRIWFGHNNGSVTLLDDGMFHPFDLSEYTKSRINAITEHSDGSVWVITQNDGVILLKSDGEAQNYSKDFSGMLLYDAMWINNELLIACDEGLITVDPILEDDRVELSYLDDSPIGVTSISPIHEGKIGIGTEDEGVYELQLIEEQWELKEYGNSLDLEQSKVSDLKFDQSGNLWISTLGNSLIQLEVNPSGQYIEAINYGIEEQLPQNIQTSFKDREGNLWVGTYGEGLYKLVDHHFSDFKFHDEEDERLEVHSFLAKKDSLWIGTNGHLLLSVNRPKNIVRKYSSIHGLPKDTINGLFIDDRSKIWVSSARSGLYSKAPGDSLFKAFELNNDKLSSLIGAFCGSGDEIYIGTKNGLFIVNTRSEAVRSLTNRDGLLHNKVRALLIDSSGTLWIGGEGNGLNTYKDGRLSIHGISDGKKLYIIRSITEDQNHNLWIGTEGDGLIGLTDSTQQYRNENGLFSNYCKSTFVDQFNQLWVGHTGGISRVDLEKGLVDVFGEESDLDLRFTDNSTYLDEGGMLWFCSTNGLTRYDHSRDLNNNIEPALSISKIYINDEEVFFDKELKLPYGTYKLGVEFIGVSHKDPDEVTYSYFLDGHDPEWNESYSGRLAEYKRLFPGDYTFKVKSFNADGFGGENVRSFKISIDPPFWQKAWFIILVVIFLFGLVRFVIHRREKFLIANQELLQEKLEERTAEVVEQKELLESKNKDITSSIEYAKNIQKAMLPPSDKLQKLFRDAFVFFKPRDIVSGDFYWVEEFDDKIILACADCTGHGVPGAFMSLIGSALLKEVCNMKSIYSPDDVLYALDEELRAMVNKGDSEFGIADGMDIAVVEFNKKTNTLRASGARRPIIVYKNGQRLELRGDRRSIGGDIRNNHREFTVHTVEMKEGDSFYLFSDGISDQFGGEKGKKLKMKGVLNILDNLNGTAMDEQRVKVRKHFYDWKGNQIQIDDIILMGVRV